MSSGTQPAYHSGFVRLPTNRWHRLDPRDHRTLCGRRLAQYAPLHPRLPLSVSADAAERCRSCERSVQMRWWEEVWRDGFTAGVTAEREWRAAHEEA